MKIGEKLFHKASGMVRDRENVDDVIRIGVL
jgi:hypothetical protein